MGRRPNILCHEQMLVQIFKSRVTISFEIPFFWSSLKVQFGDLYVIALPSVDTS